MDFKEQRQLVCEDCGETFFGLFAKYCDKCRKKRRQMRPMTMKVCERCGTKHRMYEEQVICRLCKEAELRDQRDHAKSVEEVEQIQLARKTGGKLLRIEKCPNFNEQEIRCITCSPGAWKFKDCGKIIASVCLLFLSSFLQAYTIKATGRVVAVIVEPIEVFEQVVEQKQSIVYTEIGPTLQIVF